MTQTTDTPKTSRQRVGRIVLGCTVILLILCLVTSLLANAGLAIWAMQTRAELGQVQARTAELESRVQQLQQLLEESGVEILPNQDNEQLMDTIQGQVPLLRGLDPTQPVERALMTQEQLRERMQQDLQDELPPHEARDYALTLAAFDFIDPGMDVYDLLLQLYTEQIAGFYDPETEQIYIITDLDAMGQMERLSYAHEYTHALQDQHFDLESMGLRDDAEDEYDSEYLTAIRALIEGDASLMQQQFIQSYYTPDEIVEFVQESLEIDTSVLDSAPNVLRESLYFPYIQGLAFVQALHADGGWATVDAAYANPPRSTEHILHPDRYLAGDPPQIVSLPPLTDTLGTGWRQADADTLGEYFTRLYLAQQIPDEQAETAAAGWGGDRYAVHHRQTDGALLLAIRTAWDTPTDAEEFVDAYAAYAEGRFGHPADTTGSARQCWTGTADHLCLTWTSTGVTIVLGPDRATVESVLELTASE